MKGPPRKGFTLLKEIRGPALLLGIYTSITDIALYILLWAVLIPAWSVPGSIYFDPALIYGTTIFGVELTATEYAISLAQTVLFTNLVICELLFFTPLHTNGYRFSCHTFNTMVSLGNSLYCRI